jgi:hypothetical protein
MLLNVCKEQLQKISTRDSGIFASKRKILVTLTEEKDKTLFKVDRDAGRGLYAEVTGTLQREGKNIVIVSGKGHVSISSFLLMVYMFLSACVFAVALRGIPFLAIFLCAFAVFAIPMMVNMMFHNRNELVKITIHTLKSDD